MQANESPYFLKGKPYVIRNRKTGLLLTAGFELKLAPPATLEQIWIIVQTHPAEYELIQVKTGDVLLTKEAEDGILLALQKRKTKNCNFWTIFRAEIVEQKAYYWLQPNNHDDVYLFGSSYNDTVEFLSIDQTLSVALWSIEQYPEDKGLLEQTSFIQSEFSQLIIELPEMNSKDGVNLAQGSFNGGGNQRWVFERVQNAVETNQYTIRNFCSGLVLTTNNPAKLGGKVMQTLFTRRLEQKWTVTQVGQRSFQLQSMASSGCWLSVPNTKQGSLLILAAEGDKNVWHISGMKPVGRAH